MNRAVLVVALLGLGVVLGLTLARMAPQPAVSQPIEWLAKPRSIGQFELASAAGVFEPQSLQGHWTIVLFGFLHCPDVCPTSLAQLAELADHLAKRSPDQPVSYVFVSVDPGRDSPTQLHRYVQHFVPSMLGVTGTVDALRQFSQPLGVQFKVSADALDYRVAHSSTFSILDPDGLFVGRFRPGFDTVALAENFFLKMVQAQR